MNDNGQTPPDHSKKSNVEYWACEGIRKYGPFKSIGRDRWRWNGNIWAPTDFDRILKKIFMIIPKENRTNRNADNVLAVMHKLTQINPDEEKPLRAVRYDAEGGNIRINVQNGIVFVDLEGKQIRLLPHDRYEFVTSELPLDYDPKAKCPLFERIFCSTLPNEGDRYLLQCYVGYCLLPDHRFQMALFCHGPSDSGKSLLILHAIGGGMFGSKLTSAVTLEDICAGRDGLGSLAKPLLNISSEINEGNLSDSSIFNKVISGESLNKALKYKKDALLEFNCKHIFIGNNKPWFRHGSEAQVKRLRFIAFTQNFSSKSKSELLNEKVKLEASGIFNWALRGLLEVQTLTQLPMGGDVSQAVAVQFKEANDPIGTFLDQYTTIGKGEIIAEELRSLLTNWCKFKGNSTDWTYIFPVLKDKNPYARHAPRKIDGVSKQVYFGVCFNESALKLYEELKKEGFDILKPNLR